MSPSFSHTVLRSYCLEQMQHFSILAVDSIVDIIAAYEPKVSKLF